MMMSMSAQKVLVVLMVFVRTQWGASAVIVLILDMKVGTLYKVMFVFRVTNLNFQLDICLIIYISVDHTHIKNTPVVQI